MPVKNKGVYVNPTKLAKNTMDRLSPNRLAPSASSDRAGLGLTLGHEFAERAAMKGSKSAVKKVVNSLDSRLGMKSGFYGHLSPSVLLREHNMLRNYTGPGAKAAVSNFKQLRAASGEAKSLNSAINNIRYNVPSTSGRNVFSFGESQRLSRHAIRRLTPYLNRQLEATGRGNIIPRIKGIQ